MAGTGCSQQRLQQSSVCLLAEVHVTAAVGGARLRARLSTPRENDPRTEILHSVLIKDGSGRKSVNTGGWRCLADRFVSHL